MSNNKTTANLPQTLKLPLRTIKAISKLPEHISALYQLKHDYQDYRDITSKTLAEYKTSRETSDATLAEMNEHLIAMDDRLTALSGTFAETLQAVTRGGRGTDSPPQEEKRFADNHDLDEFYIGFEDKFRGTEEQIKEKVSVYPDTIKKTGLNFDKLPVIDIGCGRGELLEALSRKHLRAIGVDINVAMVERAKQRGHEAYQGDAIAYLKSRKPNSAGAITGMHLVEHIPFEQLISLFRECYRVLAPGGIAIFETPNPENLMVGIYSFYMDPSHLHPLPPPLLSFSMETVGFKVEIQRLHNAGEQKTYDDPLLNDLSYRVYGPLDYAAIGTKPGRQVVKQQKKSNPQR